MKSFQNRIHKGFGKARYEILEMFKSEKFFFPLGGRRFIVNKLY